MAPNATIVATDRVNRINIRPYDQVFALTQYMINSGLKTRWKELLKEDPSLLGNIVVGSPGAGHMSAMLDAPQIMVESGFEEKSTGCLFVIHFKSGEFKIHIPKRDAENQLVTDASGHTVEEVVPLDLSRWKVAYAMQLDLTSAKRESEDFNEHVLKSGAYSLNDLVAKFETAIFKPEESSFGDKTWDSLSKPLQTGIAFCLGGANTMRDTVFLKLRHSASLGSVLISNKLHEESNPGLHFVPNLIQYQTYPWIDPTVMEFKPSSGFSGNQRLNYLLYCETTDGNPLPDIKNRSIKRNGNWTDGRIEASANSQNCEFGAFHMAGENFFDKYILKQLRFLNHAMEPFATRNSLKLEGVVDITPHWDSDLGVGNRPIPSEDPFYDFKRVKENVWAFQSDFGIASHEVAGMGSWSGESWGNVAGSCQNIIAFKPGSDTINVSGEVNVDVQCRFVNKHLFSSDDVIEKGLKFKLTWDLKLRLEAVDDGGLQIAPTMTEPTLTYFKNDLVELSGTSSEVQNAMSRGIFDGMSMLMSAAQGLASTHGLILPAAGVFFFKNPILGHRGDLICSIGYSEIEPEKALNPADTTRINTDAKPRDLAHV